MTKKKGRGRREKKVVKEIMGDYEGYNAAAVGSAGPVGPTVEKNDATDIGASSALKDRSTSSLCDIVANKPNRGIFQNATASMVRLLKDRLDFVDNVYFDLACKEWRTLSNDKETSLSADDQAAENHPPSMMCYEENLGDSFRRFKSLTKGKDFMIENQYFVGSKLIYSKRGWCLFVRLTRESQWQKEVLNNRYAAPYFLLKPFKGRIIQFPPLPQEEPYDGEQHLGTFSIESRDQGYPNTVVLLRSSREPGTLLINHIRVGEKSWIHSTYSRLEDTHVDWVFILGSFVYSITYSGTVYVYHIPSLTWKILLDNSFIPTRLQFMIEKDEKIIRLTIEHRLSGVSGRRIRRISKYILDLANPGWVEMPSDIETKRRMLWFLKQTGQSFGSDLKSDGDYESLQNCFEMLKEEVLLKSRLFICLKDDPIPQFVHLG